MSDKDEIKELFQKELGNYEVKVDPSLWNGIQSGLSGASATGGAASGMSLATKAVIGVVVATVATISSIVIFSNEQTNKLDKDRVEKTEYTEESTNDNSEDLIIEKSDDVKRDTEEIQSKPKNSDKPVSESKQNVNEEKEIIETPEIKETKEELEHDTDSEQPVIEHLENTSEPTKEKEAEEKTEINKPLIADISIVKRDNQYLKFELTGENIEKVEWYFGDGRSSNEFSPEHFYEEPGNFEVIAVIQGENDEVIEKKLEVTIEGEGKFTKLPNTFTPNNDGVNDEFFVEHEGINDFQLNIFNKKQELIYSTDNPDFRWRGYSSKGERVDEGEYVYVIIAKDKAGNVINKYKTLTITR